MARRTRLRAFVALDVPAVLSARINNTAEQISQASSERDIAVSPVVTTEPVVDVPPVPTWTVDRTATDSPHMPLECKEHMAERDGYLTSRLEERGAIIAAEQPEWAKQLGGVPGESPDVRNGPSSRPRSTSSTSSTTSTRLSQWRSPMSTRRAPGMPTLHSA
jgi:hypothetical protein